MQDLLYNFKSPSVMDCKIGQRTYLESEVSVDGTNVRKDLYLKMISTSPSAPTDKEHQDKGVSKIRYLQWRDSISSTAEFGFRIEAIKVNCLNKILLCTVANDKKTLVGCLTQA
ncbi:unnamed protein product [Trichobilharzia regenti]|nr:unnamed protein product [Trichobilharzia regenti]